MSGNRSNWVVRTALVAGAVALVPILGIGVIALNTWRPLHEAGEAKVLLEERFGPPGSFTPEPNAELASDRIEAFLQVRQAVHAGCDRYEPLREAFQYIDGLEESTEPVAKDILHSTELLFGVTCKITPFVGRFFEDRNCALEAAGMGLEEYAYIYVCAYRDQLLDSSVRAEIFFDDISHSPDLMDSFRSMIARQHDASEDEMKRVLTGELSALSEDPLRFPWQDGLPSAMERCLAPYRADLDAFFCAGTAGIEMDADSGRALRIAIE